MTPRKLYGWAVVKIPSVTFEYCTVEDQSKETLMIEKRFSKAGTFPGTLNISWILRRHTLCGFQLRKYLQKRTHGSNRSHICYQWKEILLQHC
jgi:hypothetical protein